MNWEAWKPAGLDPSLEYIAMARTERDCEKLRQFTPGNGARIIAFLNEPDLPGDTALPPWRAAQLWREYALPYRWQGIKLLSPAITSDPNLGLPWMDQFLGQVGDCRPDALAIHYYGENPDEFKNWANMIHDRYGLPLWVTEIASTSNDGGSVMHFMNSASDWAEGQWFIEAYMWFAASRNANINTGLAVSSMMLPDGSRTVLGDQYCY